MNAWVEELGQAVDSVIVELAPSAPVFDGWQVRLSQHTDDTLVFISLDYKCSSEQLAKKLGRKRRAHLGATVPLFRHINFDEDERSPRAAVLDVCDDMHREIAGLFEAARSAIPAITKEAEDA
jgi:hypothetical protein